MDTQLITKMPIDEASSYKLGDNVFTLITLALILHSALMISHYQLFLIFIEPLLPLLNM